jgi:hypothetical protein
MENNNTKGVVQRDKATLQLRSKEVSEVMGNIPSWIGRWGLLGMLFLFTASIFLLANIHCVQTVSGTASLKTQREIVTAASPQDLYVEVTIPAEHKPGLKQQVTLYLSKDKNSKQAGKINCSIAKINSEKDNCVLLMAANKNELQQVVQNDPSLTTSTIYCGFALDVTVFEKVVNSVF